jgi:hypothetical protein
MYPFSHMFWKFIFLSWFPSSRFLLILASLFFCSLGKMHVNHFLLFSRCYGKWSYLSFSFVLKCVKPHKAFPHILRADNTHKRGGSTAHKMLLQHTSVSKLSYSRPLELHFLNSHHCQQPVLLIRHECLVERLNHFH